MTIGEKIAEKWFGEHDQTDLEVYIDSELAPLIASHRELMKVADLISGWPMHHAETMESIAKKADIALAAAAKVEEGK